VRGGTQNLVSASAATTFDVTSDWHVRISGGARQNDDFNTPQRMVNIGSRRGDERTSVRLDSHHAWSPAVEFEVEASWTGTKQTNMVPIYLTGFEEMQVGSLKAGLNADTRYGLVQASVYRNWLDNRAFNGFFDGQQMVESNVPLVDFSNELTVARLQDIFKLGTAHTLRLSLEYRESEMNTSPTPGGEIHYDVASGGVMWQWQLLETLTLTSAARRDHLQLGREGVIPEWYGLANSAWDRSLAQTSFNIGLVWKVGARDTLRLSTARGAQLPSLFDLGGNLLTLPIPPEFGPPNAVFLSGMPDLQPTLVTNQELAWDHQLPGLNAALKVAVFRGRSTALIANYGNFLPQLNVVSAPANIGDSQSEGVELAIEGRLGDAWQWSVGYLQLDVDDDFAPQFPAGWTYVNFEETAPRHNVNASLAWTGGPWDVDLRLQYLSDFMSVRYDDEYIFNFFVPTAPTVLYPVSGYVTVGGRIGYRVNDKVTAALSVQNLFNDEQRQTAGPDVERRVMASLTYSF
jgi:iron complex outermembrane receptor protein